MFVSLSCFKLGWWHIVEDICLFRVLKDSNPLSVILRSFLTYTTSMLSRQLTTKIIPIDLWLKLNKHGEFRWRPGSVYDPFVYGKVNSCVHWNNGLESIFRFFFNSSRSSPSKMFFKIDVLKNFASFTLNKVAGFQVSTRFT